MGLLDEIPPSLQDDSSHHNDTGGEVEVDGDGPGGGDWHHLEDLDNGCIPSRSFFSKMMDRSYGAESSDTK